MSSRLFRAVDSLAREHTEKAIDTLVDVLENPEAENRDRIAAAKDLLDRGHGKPLQAVIQVPASKRQAALLASMSDEALMETIQAVPLPQMIKGREVDPLLQ